jgi:hypothetical protein
MMCRCKLERLSLQVASLYSFPSKVEANPSGALARLHSKGGFLALPTNIRLGLK